MRRAFHLWLAALRGGEERLAASLAMAALVFIAFAAAGWAP